MKRKFRSFLTVILLFLSCAGLFAQNREIELQVEANMVYIKGGTFKMGSPANEPERDDDEVRHKVKVSDFYMGKYEVTVGEFERFVNATGYRTEAERDRGGFVCIDGDWKMKADANWKNPYFSQTDNHPVVLVSWNDAVQYCNWLSDQEKLTLAYTIDGYNVTMNKNANGYRLPTEEEWEYACRAGTKTPFSTGKNIKTSQANYNGNYPYKKNAKGEYRKKTTVVGSFSPNAYGLYDMHGNVWEWCWDWYGNYTGESRPNPNYSGFEANRVFRGGGWESEANLVRSAVRDFAIPDNRNDCTGFRLVRNAK
jgi:formylglycine-generating enzyme required for sulfatase activity